MNNFSNIRLISTRIKKAFKKLFDISREEKYNVDRKYIV
jgi:hypothetical protein